MKFTFTFNHSLSAMELNLPLLTINNLGSKDNAPIVFSLIYILSMCYKEKSLTS